MTVTNVFVLKHCSWGDGRGIAHLTKIDEGKAGVDIFKYLLVKRCLLGFWNFCLTTFFEFKIRVKVLRRSVTFSHWIFKPHGNDNLQLTRLSGWCKGQNGIFLGSTSIKITPGKEGENEEKRKQWLHCYFWEGFFEIW